MKYDDMTRLFYFKWKLNRSIGLKVFLVLTYYFSCKILAFSTFLSQVSHSSK